MRVDISPDRAIWAVVVLPDDAHLIELTPDQVLSTVHPVEEYMSQDAAEARMDELRPAWRDELETL